MLLGDFLFSAGLHSCLIPTHLASITALTQSRDTQRQAAHPSGRGSTARTHFAAQSHRSMVSVCGHCRPCTPSELWTSQPDAIFLQAGADSATAPGQAGTPDTPPPHPPNTAAGFFLSHKCFHQPRLSCAFEAVRSQQCKHAGKTTSLCLISAVTLCQPSFLCSGPKLETSIRRVASDLPPARPRTSV